MEDYKHTSVFHTYTHILPQKQKTINQLLTLIFVKKNYKVFIDGKCRDVKKMAQGIFPVFIIVFSLWFLRQEFLFIEL